MISGQAVDISNSVLGNDECKKMYSLKTGCLIDFSILAGYLSSGNYHDSEYRKLSNLSLINRVVISNS